MTKSIHGMAWAGALILAIAAAGPIGVAGAPLDRLVGAGLGTVLGCVGCGAAGVYAVLSGVSLATILWSEAAFAAGTACIGVCAAALSF
ncbi:MAG TPA: hypothetical protein VLA36_15385 [Longimicrobiales bacterium]|nr:hypothetical protein [Longimicrobiales bacterium]